MISVRQALVRDYETYVSWLKAHEWPVLPREALPSRGYLAFDQNADGSLSSERPLAMAWLYDTDSTICWLEWFATNPSVSRELKIEALEQLVDQVASVAKNLGFKTIFSAVKHPTLLDVLQRKSFTANDSGMTHLGRQLW